MKTEYVNKRSNADDGCIFSTAKIGAVVFTMARLFLLAVRRSRR